MRRTWIWLPHVNMNASAFNQKVNCWVNKATKIGVQIDREMCACCFRTSRKFVVNLFLTINHDRTVFSQMIDWILHNRRLFLQKYTEIGRNLDDARRLQEDHSQFTLSCMVSLTLMLELPHSHLWHSHSLSIVLFFFLRVLPCRMSTST
jgi:hypothetical protein